MKKYMFTLALASASMFAMAQKAETIQLKKGQEIKMSTKVEQTTDMGMGTMSINSLAVAQIKVLDDAKGEYKISSKFTRITSELDGMGQNQSFDSDKSSDRESETGKMIMPTLDSTSYFMLNSGSGMVTEISETGGEVAEDKDMTEALMQTGISAKNDAAALKSFAIALPANAKPGYSWNDSTDVNGIKTYLTKKLNKIEGGLAYIDVTGTTKGSTTMDMMGSSIDMTIDGNVTGTTIVDAKTKLTKEQVLTSKVKSTMDMMGQTMNMTTDSKTTTTFE